MGNKFVYTLALAPLALFIASCADTGSVEDAAQDVQESVQALTGDPLREAAFTDVSQLPDPPEGMVTVQLRWRYQGGSLPGDGILPYETTPETDLLWTMESIPAGREVPKGDLIEDAVVFLSPGEEAHVEFVYKNPTEEDIVFVALAWYAEPYELRALTYPSCLCLSLPFLAPANGGWFRTIYFRLDPDTPPGGKMAITWTAVTDPGQFALLPGEELPSSADLGEEPTEQPVTTPTEGPAVEGPRIDIVGKDIVFDKSSLGAPADAPFTIVFDNQDANTPHNFAIYETDAARPDELLAATEIEGGPIVQELAVEGLSAGEYFYRCDVHPATMTGILSVE